MDLEKLIKNKIIDFFNFVKGIKKRTLYCILVSIILMFLSIIINKKSIYIRPNEIERGSYGTQKNSYELNLDVENLTTNLNVTVPVSSRRYTKEEAKLKFKQKLDELKIGILGRNTDYEHISDNLVFKTDLGDGITCNYSFYPKLNLEKIATKSDILNNFIIKSDINEVSTSSIIKATSSTIDEFSYYVHYQQLVDGYGNVNNDDFQKMEYCTGYIELLMSTDIKEQEGSYKSEKFLIPVTIISKEMSLIESFINAFSKEVRNRDIEYINQDTIVLPKVVNDFKINYKEKNDFSFLIIPIIGILIAILLEAKDKEKIKEEEKKKARQLEVDFTQIISKVLLYVSSGMTIRNSLIRIASRYQKEIKDNNIVHIAYDELVLLKNKLSSGFSEIKSYEEMAKNINKREYTRFISILIQSMKNGNKELKNILTMEVQDALYERKQHAKKLGEEASTKLVLPLMMMLSVVMIIIMVPAFMGM